MEFIGITSSLRKKLKGRRGRKKESEKGIKKGEQNIGKFLRRKEEKFPTPKRKILDVEEKEETGSEKKKMKLDGDEERKKGGVKALLGLFETDISSVNRKNMMKEDKRDLRNKKFENFFSSDRKRITVSPDKEKDGKKHPVP